jgi:hypothetical protein
MLPPIFRVPPSIFLFFVVGDTGPTGATGATGDPGAPGAPGATGATGTFSATGTLFYASNGTGTSGASIPIHLNDKVAFATDTPSTVKMSVATGVAGAVITINSTAAGGGAPAPTGVTGAAPASLSAAQYAMRAIGEQTYADTNLLPYQTLIYQPTDGSIQMDDRTVTIRDSGNYLINLSVTSIATSNIPNIHALIDDFGNAGGTARHRDIDVINVLASGMTSTSIILPIAGPGRVSFQVQGASANFKSPTAQPQGQLSIVKIS